jgi:hypothetical protein
MGGACSLKQELIAIELYYIYNPPPPSGPSPYLTSTMFLLRGIKIKARAYSFPLPGENIKPSEGFSFLLTTSPRMML